MRTWHGAAVDPGGGQDGPAPTGVDAGAHATSVARYASPRAQALLVLPAVGYLVPAFGPWLSLLLMSVVVRPAAAVLWGDRARHPRVIALLGGAALWWPAVVAFFFLNAYSEHLGNPESDPRLRAVTEVVDAAGITYWLVIPLAALDDWVSPGAAALVVVVLGAVASARVRRPWPWLLAAAVAPLAYALVVWLLRIPFSS